MDADQIRAFQRQLRALVQRQRREGSGVADLSRSAIRVLGAVAHGNGAARAGLIAQDLAMSGPNVAAALRELDAHGLLARRRDPGDARKVDLSLTEAGRQLVSTSRSLRDSWLAEAVEAVLTPAEQDVLVTAGVLMERLARYLPAREPEPT